MQNVHSQRDEIERLQAHVAELEGHTKALLVAERRAYQAKQRLGEQLELLCRMNDLSKILSTARSPALMIEEALEFVVREFSYEAGMVLMLDAVRKHLSATAASGLESLPRQTLEISALKETNSVLWRALNESRPVLAHSDLLPEEPAFVLGLKDFLAIPLVVEKCVPIGLVLIGNTRERGVYYRPVREEDSALLLAIAGQVALMLQKAELYEHLQREKEELERAQLELRTVNERLEQRVKEKTRALQESMEELEESRLQLEQYSRELEEQVKERTRRLQESEERYRSVIANSNAGIAVYREGVILEINPALTEITGQHLEGCPLSDFVDRVIDPERHADLWKYLNNEGCVAGDGSGNYEAHVRRGEEERVWNISAFALDSENELYAFLVVDTTETRRVEEQLFGSQKMASLGTLAGGIAHEFNNILVGVLGNASLLRTKVVQDAEMSRLAEAIENSALRAAELVQQLLGFARKGKYRSERLDLNTVVRETLELARRSFDPGVELVLDLSPDLYPVEGDATQIQQVVMNLALNAKEALRGSGVLTGRTRSVVIDEEAAREVPDLRPGQWVEIEIHDTGMGMDEETKRKIFEPFFSTKGSGATGLGLPMVYGIVSNHGGAVGVRSELGGGTSFLVYLPAAMSGQRVRAPASAARGDRKASILVVDDEEIIRRVCLDALTESGYTVHVESDGPAALRYFRSNEPTDLVILDLGMPKMSGREAFQELKRLAPDLKIVICSGCAAGSPPDKTLKDRADAVLDKPFTFQQLVETVEGVLSQEKD